MGPDNRSYSVFDFPFRDTDGSPLILEMGIDITERKQAEAELKIMVAKLEQSNLALQDFASIASHDMQEPLRKIISFGKLLQDRLGGSPAGAEEQDFLSRMQRAAERMQVLLTALLEYSRVTTRAEPFRDVSLSDILEEVMEDLEVRIHTTGARLEFGPLPTLHVDPSQMHQLFQNLIGNALKYRGGEEPIVRVYAETAGNSGSMRICVEDNGIGFDEEHMDRIFQPFQRLHGRDSEFEGTGMGLAICKKIVERHGGVITARSIPGVGSTFIVDLPKDMVAKEDVRQLGSKSWS
jgi:light-regulated signal transduction histidine kinase (bacteriophytochrome)